MERCDICRCLLDAKAGHHYGTIPQRPGMMVQLCTECWKRYGGKEWTPKDVE